jgi:hypothetical protein
MLDHKIKQVADSIASWFLTKILNLIWFIKAQFILFSYFIIGVMVWNFGKMNQLIKFKFKFQKMFPDLESER